MDNSGEALGLFVAGDVGPVVTDQEYHGGCGPGREIPADAVGRFD